MLSLNNANDEEELREFEERIQRFLKHSGADEYAVEPKIDGLAVELVYLDGKFTVARRVATVSMARTSRST